MTTVPAIPPGPTHERREEHVFMTEAMTEIPWGAGGETLSLRLPADWPEAEVIWPDLQGLARAVEQSSDARLGSAHAFEHSRPHLTDRLYG